MIALSIAEALRLDGPVSANRDLNVILERLPVESVSSIEKRSVYSTVLNYFTSTIDKY